MGSRSATARRLMVPVGFMINDILPIAQRLFHRAVLLIA